MCSNKISFTSGRFNTFLKKMRSFDYSGGDGFDVNNDEVYIYNLCTIDDYQFTFKSKDGPPIVEFYYRAKKSGFSFVLEYEDLSRNVFGIATYDHNSKMISSYDVPQFEFAKLNWDEEGNVYDDEKTIANLYDWLKEKLDIEMNKKVGWL